ncbi:ImpA family type VI secretion system protein [Nereida sp. MMG025]|uniref:type VI secretion system protein TssA n=1 Tax=Nereida sp. MMG025 TaxID=2909981 RepID=UPI001F35D944|nr:type VI secretion system ImpA family N-terminal domain-containing protein [Nereida sp. MMG025]MCF6445714.1 type VI secretion system ImpA family N-terminal domain-containing protein [Nereida sp. MMG025]
MSLEWIKDAVSDDSPSGPDLWMEDDPTFSEYYFDALGRLPEADDYVKLGLAIGEGQKAPDKIFDPKTVALKTELKAIDALLKKTRDVRLLTLRAQWAALASNPKTLDESIAAMADLIEAMPEDAHPNIEEAPRDRLEAINDLGIMGAMILPLRYHDIAQSGATRRRVMVCNGSVTRHDGEDDLNLESMLGHLSKVKDVAKQEFEYFDNILRNLGRIEVACLSASKPHTPQLQTLKDEITAVMDVISMSLPELKAESTENDTTSDAEESGPTGPDAKVPDVKSHDEARRRLAAVETYFGLNEPSSAAVLLVTQARLLIGKSLIDAFDILMPNSAERAKVDFISDNGFQLAHGQLRSLANEVLIEEVAESVWETEPVAQPEPEPEVVPAENESDQDEVTTDDTDAGLPDADATVEVGDEQSPDVSETDQEAVPDVEPEPAPEPDPIPASVSPLPMEQSKSAIVVRDAAAAGTQILAVETYFRTVERSSPIPMLLKRARSYIGKDFEALLKEFVPKQDY